MSLNQNNTQNVLNDSTSKINTSFDFYIIRISVEHKNFETDGMLNVKYLKSRFLCKCIILILDINPDSNI